MLNSAPSWLLDNPTDDPLLSQLEDERRRRAAQQQIEAQQPIQTTGTEAPPLFTAPDAAHLTPAPVEDSDVERLRRDAEAAQGMAQAKEADLRASGIDPSAQPAPTAVPQDTGAAFKGPTGTTTEAVNSWDGLVQAASATYGVPVNVIKGIMDIESKGDPAATSSMGAAGLMQVMNFHAKNGEDLYDPSTNIEFGTRILAENFARYGTWEQAAAAYFGAIDADGNVSGASDGNADGYTYVDLFTSKANAYLEQQQGTSPVNGPSLPGGAPIDITDLRRSQFDEALSMEEAYAACGPAAAIVFAAMMGRAPSLREAVDIAKSIKAWDEGIGMYGIDAEVRLIEALGGKAKYSPGFDTEGVISEVSNGNPVMVNSPATGASEGHYGIISGYDPVSGRFYFGSSATDLKGGQPWMTLQEYEALGATGPVTGVLMVDNPISRGPSAASAVPGSRMPANWNPSGPKVDDAKTARSELQAAQDLAAKVQEQVEEAQKNALKKSDSAGQVTPMSEMAQLAMPTLGSAESANQSMDLLKQPVADTPPLFTEQQATTPASTTDSFVTRAREIESRFPDATAREADPNYQLEVTRLAREWQESANPSTAVTVEAGGNGLGVVRGTDGSVHQATEQEMFADPTIALANQELKNREAYLQREIETRAEQAQIGQIWTLTPDEYTAWRKSQGMPIRPDEYQRHAIAVLEAQQQGQTVPEKVLDAYGSDVKDRWQKDRRTALAPIESVANGAPYDGADAEHRYQGIMNLPTQAAAVAEQARNAFALATLGIVKGWAQSADAGAEKIERMTGLPSSNTFGYAADQIERFIQAHPELQSPDRPPEDFLEALSYSAGVDGGGFRVDRFVRNAAMLAPYLVGGGAVRSVIGKALAATGTSGAALGLGTTLASGVAITGLPAFGQFYDEATTADPKTGQKPLSKDDALIYAGLHATIQIGIEAAMGETFGKLFGMAAARSPMLKKTSELLARASLANAAKQGFAESFEEGAQQISENVISKLTYDPGRSVWDGVGAAMGSTFGPSVAMAGMPKIGSARAEAREASFRYATSIDQDRRQEMVKSVTDVASAGRFADEQMAKTAEYGRSVGWDQRQIDLAQFRAAQAIYGYGLDKQLNGRTTEQAANDPEIKQGLLALRLAREFEQRLSNKTTYESGQKRAAFADDLERRQIELGYKEVAPTDVADDPRSEAERLRDEHADVQKLILETGRYDPQRPALIAREARLAERIERASQSDTSDTVDGQAHPINETFNENVTKAIEHQNELAGGPAAEWTPEGLRLRLIRQQQPEQGGAWSSRGGAYYAVEGNRATQAYYAKGPDGHGGPVRVDRTITLRNPYFVQSGDGNGTFTIIDTFGNPDSKIYNLSGSLNEAASRVARYNEDPSKLHEIWRGLGFPIGLLSEIDRESRNNNIEIREKRFTLGVRETAASELLRRNGYDGMVAYDYPMRTAYEARLVSHLESPDRYRLGEVFYIGDRRYPDQSSLPARATLAASGATQTVPRETARTGQFEAPGLDQGAFTTGQSVQTLKGINASTRVPVMGTDNVTAVGGRNAPQEMVTKVANRAYAGAFARSAQNILTPAMGILQRIADRRILEEKDRSPRIAAKFGNIAVGAPEVYGWTDLTDDNGVAISPAEIYHAAIVAVSALEAERGTPFTDAERRSEIVRQMALKAVEVVVHESAHHWDVSEKSQAHGVVFDRIHKPVQAVLRLLTGEKQPTANALHGIDVQYGLESGHAEAIYEQAAEMVEQVFSTLNETFSTLEAGDQLVLLNDDAREQRMLTLPGAQNGNQYDGGDDLRNDDFGAGPPVSPESDAGDNRATGAGAGGEGLRTGPQDAALRAVTPGAPELGPIEPAPTESGGADGTAVDQTVDADGQPDTADAGASREPLRTALLPDPYLKQVESFFVKAAKRHNGLDDAGKQADADLVAERWRAANGDLWDRHDPAVIKWQLGLVHGSAAADAADRIMAALYPGRPSDPAGFVEHVVGQATSFIEANPEPFTESDDGRRWTPEQVDRHVDTGGNQRLQLLVLGELVRRGYTNQDGEEQSSERWSSETTAPATETEAAPAATPTISRQPRTAREPVADERVARQNMMQRAASSSLEQAIADVASDEFIDNMSRGNTPGRYGAKLRETLTVEDDPDLSEQNFQEFAEALVRHWRQVREARKNGTKSEKDVAQRRSLILREIGRGFGIENAVYSDEPRGSTQTSNDGARVIWKPAADTRLEAVVVEGLGRMALDQSRSTAERKGVEAMARAVQNLGVSRFEDRDGNPISMQQFARDAVANFFGDTLTADQFIEEMSQVAADFLAANGGIDITQPKLMMVLMQAHEQLATKAFSLIQEAQSRDAAAGNRGAPIQDAKGKIIAYGGPEFGAALKATAELMEASTLLKSVRKLGTASGRTLRAMQFAEERSDVRQNLSILGDLNGTTESLINLLKKAQAAVDPSRGSGSGNGRGSGNGSRSVDELFKALNDAGFSAGGYFGKQIEALSSVEDIRKLLESEPGMLTQQDIKYLERLQKIEEEGGQSDPERNRAIATRMYTRGMAQRARRLQNRQFDPETGKSHQAKAKEDFRKSGENYAKELISRRIDSLEAWQIEQLRKQIEGGAVPLLDEVMKNNPQKQALYDSLHTKLAEIISWQRQHDPETKVYKKAHPGTLAGASTLGTSMNPQQELGDLYRTEIDYDTEIEYLEEWVAEAKGRDQSVAGNAAMTARLESRLAERVADREVARELIAAAEADITVDLWVAMSDAIDKSHAARDEKEAKLSLDGLASDVNLRLGAALYGKLNQDALLHAMEGRDIGRVEREVRRVMKEHFHQGYDDKVELEYWVGFSEDIERRYGASTDPQVRAWLAENRAKVTLALQDLAKHPQVGPGLAGQLNGRMIKAIHGDAGALVSGISRSLTAPGYRVDGTYPLASDVEKLQARDVIELLAGTADKPGPLTRVQADRFDTDAMTDLRDALSLIETDADGGLGATFKEAVLAAVDIGHHRAAVLELVPMVQANSHDLGLRTIVEQQLFDLKEKLAERETEQWFRQRFGSTELSLRRTYERAIERGVELKQREIDRDTEAVATYNALVAAGVDTEDDQRRMIDGKPYKRFAAEIIVRRTEELRIRDLRRQIRVITERLWVQTDADERDRMEDLQVDLLDQLRAVGRYVDPKTGEQVGAGLRAAEQVEQQIIEKSFKEEAKQGVRQQGWIQQDEIKALVARIREVHRYVLSGHPGDDTGQIEQALQQELQGLFWDLEAVGAGETDAKLKDMGLRAAEKLQQDLDLRTVRFAEKEQERSDRRAATNAVRDLKNEAMPLVRSLIQNPADKVVRAELHEVLRQMAAVGYMATRDVEITDTDPTNGAIIGRRTERQQIPVDYGWEHANRIMAMATMRSGASIADLQDEVAANSNDRDNEKNVVDSLRDRVKILMTAARESDNGARMHAEITAMLGLMEQVGVAGRAAAQKERERLQRVGFSRANLISDEQARGQATAFFSMIQPVLDPNTGELVTSGRAISQAIRLVTAPNFATFYREYGIVAMLSSPTTWGFFGVNNIGQLLNLAIVPARWGTTLGIDMFRGMIGYDRTVFASEGTAAIGALKNVTLWKDAGKGALQIIRYGRSQAQATRASETGDLRDLQPEYLVDWTNRDGAAWRVLNAMTTVGHMSSLRILKAMDEFIGTLTYAAAFEAQMERKQQQTGKSRLDIQRDINLLSDVVKRTGHIKTAVLFQEKDKMLGLINQFAHSPEQVARDKRNIWHGMGSVLMATYIPFTTVPYNSLKQSIELSGVGAVYHAGAAASDSFLQGKGSVQNAEVAIAKEKKITTAQLRLADSKGEMARQRALEENEQIVQHLGKAALGALVQLAGYYLASFGMITGDEPEDPDDRKVDEFEKLPPRSIYIGGRWYSYDSTPFAVPFAIAGNYFGDLTKAQVAAEKARKGSGTDALTKAGAVGAGLKSAVFHNFFLENAIELGAALIGSDNKTTAETQWYRGLSPFVTRNTPAILAYFARQGDHFTNRNFERDTRAEDTGFLPGNVDERLVNLGKSRIPILRSDLPDKLGVLGKPLENKAPFGAGLISYSRSQEAQFDQLFRVLGKYGIKEFSPKNAISAPGRQNASFEISLDEQRTWQKTFGENLRREVATTYNSTAFKRIYNVASNQDPQAALVDMQRQMLDDAVGRARSKADAKVIEGFGADKIHRDLEINRRIAEGRRKRAVTADDIK